MFKTIKEVYGKFECWVHSWFPGLKTKAMLLLGTVGNGAAVLQGFFTGLPTFKYITPEMLGMISMALYVLAFWFQGMGDRVKTFEEKEAS